MTGHGKQRHAKIKQEERGRNGNNRDDRRSEEAPIIKPEIKTTLHLKSVRAQNFNKMTLTTWLETGCSTFFWSKRGSNFFYILTTKWRQEIGDREWGVTCSKGPELRPYDQIYLCFVQDWRGSVLISYWQMVLIYILPLGSEAQERNIKKKEKE